jgi:hypothetical protein
VQRSAPEKQGLMSWVEKSGRSADLSVNISLVTNNKSWAAEVKVFHSRPACSSLQVKKPWLSTKTCAAPGVKKTCAD